MRTLLLSISFFCITLGYSQDSKFNFGVQGGLTYSDYRGNQHAFSSDEYTEKPGLGFLGGLHVEYQLKKRMRLKLEVSYEQKIQKEENTFTYSGKVYNFTSKKNQDYVVIPLMLKYSFRDQNSFYVNGGPFIGFLLKSDVTNDLKKIENVNTNTIDNIALYKKTDFGVTIGVGKTFEINQKSSIYIEIRENLGLSNINNYDIEEYGNLKTNSLNLMVGYSLN